MSKTYYKIYKDANGNVGIGTTSPGSTLEIARGSGTSTAKILGTTYSSHFNYSTDEHTYIRGGKATSKVYINDSHSADVLIATGGGSVGIGTAGPGTTKLRVVNGSSGQEIFKADDGATAVIRAKVDGTVSFEKGITLAGRTSALNTGSKLQVDNAIALGSSLYTFSQVIGGADLQLISNANPANIGVNSNIIFKLGTSGGGGPVERMRIVSDGKIQIGNNIPMWSGAYGGALVLKGDNATSNRYAQLAIVDSTGSIVNDGLKLSTNGDLGLNCSPNNYTNKATMSMDGVWGGKIEILVGGNVKSDWEWSTGGLSVFGTKISESLQFKTNNTGRVLIDPNGNVKIGSGTANASGKLEIVGNLIINGASNSNVAQQVFTRTDVSWGIFNETNLRIYSSNSNTTSPSTLRFQIASTGAIQFSAYGSGSFTGTSTHYLTVDSSGNVIKELISSGTPTGSGTTNYIPKWNGAVSLTNSAIYEDANGNIGVGITTPVRQLVIYDSTGSEAQMQFQTSTTGAANAQGFRVGYNGSGGNIWNFENNYVRIATNNSERMRIDAGGSVGIGTTSPSTQLDIYGTSDTYLTIRNDGNGYDAGIRMYGGSAGISHIWHDDTEANPPGIHFGTSANVATAPTSQLYIKGSDGNVGIGTTSPSSTLHVVDGTSGASVLTVDGTNGTLFEVVDDLSGSLMSVNDAAGLPVLEVFADSHIVAGRYGQNDFYLDTNGNLGLGTASPEKQFHVLGGTADNSSTTIRIGGSTNHTSKIELAETVSSGSMTYGYSLTTDGGSAGSGTNNFLLRNHSASAAGNVALSVERINGYVGIGTATPTEELHLIKSADTGIGMEIDNGNSGASAHARIGLKNNSDDLFYILNHGSGRTSTTRYGIAVADYSEILAQESVNGLLIGTGQTNTPIIFGNNNGERMRIAAGGNVGINQTNPANYKLYVSGTGTDYNNSVIRTDSSSNQAYTYSLVGIAAGGLSTGNRMINMLGTAFSSYNAAYWGFKNTGGTSSASNEITFGLFGYNDLIRISATNLQSLVNINPAADATYSIGTSSLRWLATYTAKLLAGDGSASAPGITFINDTDTGLFRDASDYLNITVGGTEVVSFNSNGLNFVYNVNGSVYQPLEGGVATGRYWLMFDYTNNASYPFLTNRTPSGKVVIKTGVASGGGENTHFTIEGGDGTVDAYFENANLGIGTTSPSKKLHVLDADLWQSRFSYDSTRYLDVGYQGILATYGGNGNDMYVGTVSAGASNGHLIFQTIGSERVRISRDGNVGIGTTSPTSKLNVYSSTAGASIFSADGTSGRVFEITDDISTSLMSVNTIAGLPAFEVFADYHIVAGRYNQNDFYLDTNGNLGLGTASPTFKLDVAGDARINDSGAANGTASQTMQVVNTTTGATSSYIYIGASSGTDWKVGKNILGTLSRTNFDITTHANVFGLTINTSGSVGVGLSDPGSYALNVEHPAGGAMRVGQSGGIGLDIGHTAYSASNAYTGIKNTDWTGTADYALIVGTADTYLSAKSGGTLHLRGGGNQSNGGIYIYGDGSVVVNEGQGNADFRVEGDTATHLLFTDASADRVGIGVSSPSYLLDVAGDAAANFVGKVTTGTNGAANDPFRLESDTTSWLIGAAPSASSGNITWGLFWAGNSGAAYGTNGAGGPGNIWNNSGNPNEFVFVGAASTKWTVYGNTGDTWQAGGALVTGSVGIGTNTPSEKLHLNAGSFRISGDKGIGVDGGSVHVPVVGGGGYATTTSTVTGYLKITLPQTWTNTMMQFTVDVYEYGSNGQGKSFTFSGYNYSGDSKWYNVSAYMVTDNDTAEYTIHFGHDGSYCAIYIDDGGGASSSWAWPQVRVRDFFGGYSNYEVAKWVDGWNVSFTTTLGTITRTRTCGGGGAVNGSGAANKVAFWTDANTLSNNTNFHWDNSNERLGIGTASPISTSKLDVRGTTHSQSFNLSKSGSSIGAAIELTNQAGDANSNDLTISAAHSTNSVVLRAAQKIEFWTYQNSAYNHRLGITNSGDVGIGTASPSTRTHIYGTLTVDSSGNSTNSYTEGIRLGASSNGYSIVAFGVNASASSGSQANQWWIGRYGGTNHFNFYNPTGGNVVNIKLDGNVGIGTTSASQKLDVYGNIRALGRIDAGLLNHSATAVTSYTNAAPSSNITVTSTGKNIPHTYSRGIVWTGKHYITQTYDTDQIYFYDNNFDAIENHNGNTSETLPGNPSNPHGVAWDGRYLWLIGYGSGTSLYLDAYDLTGSSITRVAHCSVNTSVASATYGLGYAEGLLYIVIDGRVQAYRWEGGDTAVQIFSNPSIYNAGATSYRAQGVTYDGSHLWVVQNGQALYKLNLDGDIITSISNPFSNSCGLTWNGENLVSFNYSTGEVLIGHTDKRVFLTDKFGIGTTNPQQKLHITGGNVLIEGGSTDSRLIGFTSYDGVTGWSIGNGIIDSTHNFRIYDNTAGAARVTVNGNGNLGIGTTSPTNGKLVVAGDGVITGDLMVGRDGTTTLYAAGQTTYSETSLCIDGSDNVVGIRLTALRTTGSSSYEIWADSTALHFDTMNGGRDFVFNSQGGSSDVANQVWIMQPNGNVGIGTNGPSYKLQVIGSFAATTKSFDIAHPTKEGKRLVYASLEGPENGVYVRGRQNTFIIELPDYWVGLVHEDSITVNLTSIGRDEEGNVRNYSVDDIKDNKVFVYTDSPDKIYNYFYTINAERKDVDKLEVEKEEV